MKNKAVVAITLLVMILTGAYFYKKYRIAPNVLSTQLELLDSQNKSISLLSLKGKPYILTFYASWCADCLREMPAIDKAIKADLNHLPVIAITDEPLEKLNSFAKSHDFKFNYYKLVKEFKYYNIYAIPTTYVFDKQGKIIFNQIGFVDWSDKAFIEFIKKSTL
jgi:peroxiredoxin